MRQASFKFIVVLTRTREDLQEALRAASLPKERERPEGPPRRRLKVLPATDRAA